MVIANAMAFNLVSLSPLLHPAASAITNQPPLHTSSSHRSAIYNMFVLNFWFFSVSKIGGAINKMSGGNKMMVVAGEKILVNV